MANLVEYPGFRYRIHSQSAQRMKARLYVSMYEQETPWKLAKQNYDWSEQAMVAVLV